MTGIVPKLSLVPTARGIMTNLSAFSDLSVASDEWLINKKRIYVKQAGAIIDDWQNLNGKFGETFVQALVDFRRKCDAEELNNENIHAAVDQVLEPCFDYAFEFCNANYHVEIMSAAQNIELQFDRDHIIVLLASAMMFRSSIPLLTEFIRSQEATEDIGMVFLNYFITVIRKVETRVTNRHFNMENKLRRLAESRVFGTEYSDAVVWNYLKNVGGSPVEFIQPLYRKLIIDITPKLTLTENVINFYHVVIKKQLQYAFHSKIPMSYETVNSAIEPDEASIFDTDVTKVNQNEMFGVLMSLGIEDMFAKVKRSIAADLSVTPDEIQRYALKITPSKEKIILYFMLYGKFTEEREILYIVNHKTFTMLMIMLNKILVKFGMTELAKVIMSEPIDTELSPAKFKLTKKYITQIKTSERYSKLRDEKFSDVGIKFDSNNIVFTLLESVLRSSRQTIPIDSTVASEQVVIDPEILADELIKLIGFIV